MKDVMSEGWGEVARFPGLNGVGFGQYNGCWCNLWGEHCEVYWIGVPTWKVEVTT